VSDALTGQNEAEEVSISNASYDAALANIARWGDTDVFPKPLENHVIAERSVAFRKIVQNFARDITDRLAEDPPLVIAAAPNGYAGFRWVTQLDPVWNSYLLAATLDIAPQIESARLSKDYVTSHRLEPSFPDARLFSDDGYSSFQKQSIAALENSTHVVVTDISNFYGGVYHHRLENALESLPKMSGRHKKIAEFLSRIAGNKSYGLPVGGPASRILAEILLNRTDWLLLARGVRFLRYADDYRLFATSEDEAYRQLAVLAEVLAINEGFSLQKSKTRVMTATEFRATVLPPSVHDSHLSPQEFSARQLLNFRLRFDPYSPTKEEDYERLEEEIDKLDLVDLFSVELSKSRIDPQFTRKLLKAVQFASPTTKSAVAESLSLNLPLLAPVLPQTLAAIRGLWDDVQPVAQQAVVGQLVSLWEQNSYLLHPGVTRSYAVRLLGMDSTRTSDAILDSIFRDSSTDALVRRDVILAMARRRGLWWLSNLMQRFGDLQSGWERRAFLAATPVMTEEATHFVRKTERSLTEFESLVLSWARDHHKADINWLPPL
jgi:Reverse transcriptase (RNA-dependent DNA polymerase)